MARHTRNIDCGITPTHVGKSYRCRRRRQSGWDHPHPCGEKKLKRKLTICLMGSPPPMWGKVIDIAEQWRLFGITPTHVGKSSWNPCRLAAVRDHPHPCGEKTHACESQGGTLGSPPPMWGKARCCEWKVTQSGITPTHVGKSKPTRRWLCRCEDHPHPCGEKVSMS